MTDIAIRARGDDILVAMDAEDTGEAITHESHGVPSNDDSKEHDGNQNPCRHRVGQHSVCLGDKPARGVRVCQVGNTHTHTQRAPCCALHEVHATRQLGRGWVYNMGKEWQQHQAHSKDDTAQ